MKVIFLDFNGVLDTNENMDVIDSGNLMRLKRIVDETDSKVVISSSLKDSYYYTGHFSKMMLYILEVLESSGIDVIGITPKLDSRENEIKEYLNQHSEIENYVILDDDYYMEDLSEHLVKLESQMVVGQKGLEEKYMIEAINILCNKKLTRI